MSVNDLLVTLGVIGVAVALFVLAIHATRALLS